MEDFYNLVVYIEALKTVSVSAVCSLYCDNVIMSPGMQSDYCVPCSCLYCYLCQGGYVFVVVCVCVCKISQ